jgi:hypothetical protein
MCGPNGSTFEVGLDPEAGQLSVHDTGGPTKPVARQPQHWLTAAEIVALAQAYRDGQSMDELTEAFAVLGRRSRVICASPSLSGDKASIRAAIEHCSRLCLYQAIFDVTTNWSSLRTASDC